MTLRRKLVVIKFFPVRVGLMICVVRRVFEELVEDSGILRNIFYHNSVNLFTAIKNFFTPGVIDSF